MHESSTMVELAKDSVTGVSQCPRFCMIEENSKGPLTNGMRKSLGQICKLDAPKSPTMAEMAEESTMVVVQRPVFPTIAENFRGTITSGMKKRQGQPEPKYVGPESSTMAKLAKEPPIIKAAQCLGFCTIAMNLKAPLTSCTLRKLLGQACKGDALEPSSMAKLVEEPAMEEAQRLGFRTTAENSRSINWRL